MNRARTRLLLVAAVAAPTAFAAAAPPASALNPLKAVCGVAGVASGVAKGVCTAAENGGRLLTAGKQLLSGRVGSALKSIAGGSGVASKVTTALALAAIGTWVVGGARSALTQTAHVLSETTTPQLTSTWFSATYWKVAGVSALLTLPFLFAATVQALLASDVTLLLRSALGYLPLAMLGVAIAAPLTMLLLSASDQLSSIVSSAAGHASGHFLDQAAIAIGAETGISGSPFLIFIAALLTVGMALALWLELLVRAAAVYVIVLLLPLAFASFVWPARRIWLVRALEMLIALILSKFVIVAVLALGGAALDHSFPLGFTGIVAGTALLGIGVCAPWALVRLLPITELATNAAGSLRGDIQGVGDRLGAGYGGAVEQTTPDEGAPGPEPDWVPTTTAQMRRDLASTQALSSGGDNEPLPGHGPTGSPNAGPAPVPPPGPDPSPIPSTTPEGAPVITPLATPGQPGTPEPSARPATPEPSVQAERSPGLGPMWQANDFSWETLDFGPDAAWPPRLWGDDGASSDGATAPDHPGEARP